MTFSRPNTVDRAAPPGRRRRLRTSITIGAVAGLCAAAVVTATPASAFVPQGASSQVGSGNSFSPQVVHTAQGPTGYAVTFRFKDPTATRVQIKGEWYFSDPAQTTTTSSQGLLPQQWVPGVVPMAYPQSTGANWPVQNLTQDGRTGIWSITVPLPSGMFTYGFFVNCASATGAGCQEISDPSNPPWNSINGVSSGSTEPDSEVYVPSDPAFGTTNYSWQSPSTTHGNLVAVSYPSPQSITPAGTHPLAVYTPPNYDPFRSTPYPTLYLSHGGGGQEIDWSTQGAAGNILDNLITSKQIQPMVVVMTNFNGLPRGAEPYAQDLISNVIPYVQKFYNVSTSAADRAFAGLSVGGAYANNLLYNHTAEFGYYSVMSNAGGNPATVTPEQATALKAVTAIQIGGGIQDPLRPQTTAALAALTGAGVPFTDDSINGGHEWYVWRILLHDFLVQQAFKGTSTTLTTTTDGKGVTTAATATVTKVGTTGAAPTGTVQFRLDGALLRAPVKLRSGTASITLPRSITAGRHTLTATYSGDSQHAPSSATTVISGKKATSKVATPTPAPATRVPSTTKALVAHTS